MHIKALFAVGCMALLADFFKDWLRAPRLKSLSMHWRIRKDVLAHTREGVNTQPICLIGA